MIFSNDEDNSTTDANGFYSNDSINYGWEGEVTPSHDNYEFNPVSRPYSNVSSDYVNQDFGGIRVSILDESQLPTTYTLSPAFPNPFNPRTTIRFGLPKQSNITLIIYNLQDQEIMRWDEQNVQAGYHSKDWNGTNKFRVPVSSGIYLYRLVAGDFVKTRKMILLK